MRKNRLFAQRSLLTITPAIGVSDITIIDTQDALLVARKNISQNINNFVEKLRHGNRCESYNHI
jgi:mannose-1-phosphate guanylyltransferase / mannose-6-phosphate isomerase